MESGSEFEGKAVAVVGGSLGVGPAVVRAFLDKGARVASGEFGEPPQNLPPEALILPIDLARPQSVTDFLDACEKKLGGLDVLVMSARPVKVQKVLDVPPEEIARVIQSELTDVILCLQATARRMAARKNGRIISFCSMSGKTGVHGGVSPYAAAKGGLITFSRSMAADLAATGVTVNCIATALFDAQVAAMPDERLSEIVKGIPVGRVGRSEEAAHAVLYLASRNGGYVTGETLNLSGGRFMD